MVAYALVRELPFDKPGRFYRGNIHAHSTNSDGTLPPQELASLYREAGYDFLAITDHYRQRYGFPVTDTCPSAVRASRPSWEPSCTRPRPRLAKTGIFWPSACPPTSPLRAPRRESRTSRAGRWRPGPS